MNKKIVFIGLILCCSLFVLLGGCKKKTTLLGPQKAQASNPNVPEQNKKILVIHSYHKEYEWCAAINRGIRMVITDSDYTIEEFYMDTKRKTASDYMQQIGRSALDLIRQWDPDVVILADDNAQEYVGTRLVGQDKPQVVFCGVNRNPEDYGYPASNVTGILERPLFSETLEYLKELVPDVQKMAILSDTGLTTDGAFDYMQKQPTHGIDIVQWCKIETFEDWKQKIHQFQDQVDAIAVYTYHRLKTSGLDSDSVPSKEVMAWTRENCNIPIAGFLVFAIDDGSLCGVLESGTRGGIAAAEIALQIFEGKKASDFHIKTSHKGQKMLNLNVADQLNMKIPAETIKKTDVIIHSK